MTNDTTRAPLALFSEARAAAEKVHRLLPVLACEGGELKIGEPLRVLYVRRDLLKRYEAGADPRPLLSDVGELLYPVAAGGEVAAAVRVVEGEGGWTIKSVGEANLARDLEAVRARDAAAAKPESFVVH